MTLEGLTHDQILAGVLRLRPNAKISLNGNTLTWLDETPEPTADEIAAAATLPPVPQSVAMWKTKTVLQQYGFLDAVNSVVAASNNAALQFAWGPNGAQEIRRDSNAIAAMAQAVGLSSDQVDAMFIAAAAIEV